MSIMKYPALVDWIRKNGGYFNDDVEILHNEDMGSHVRVRKDKRINADTRIASCPMACTLSILNALDIAPFTSRGTRFPQPFLKKCTSSLTIECFFLMEQYVLGAKSWWAPYITNLPTPEQTKTFYLNQQEDLVWTAGTNLQSALEVQDVRWQSMYAAGLQILCQCKWPIEKRCQYSL